ncbi:GntR family transcriptional regulator [Streptomyces sp. NPDC058664]|uniref:GntR family transcriptional regulator n=1 Tax=unclassified Streptomyces TaxID=2593676 RepID=UPI0036514857
MEQGPARERATERPSPPFGDAARADAARTDPAQADPAHADAVRVPGQTRGARQGPGVRGEHTRGGPSAPRPAGLPAPRVVRHSVRGQILDALRAALVDGELVPGEVYSAPVLGERFGVSATPVREAMQRLAVEGAVEVVPNRGFRVTERTPRELAELAEVRALIEVPVMLRLARTVPAARWAALRPLAEATSAAAARGDRAHYAETDRAFHRAVLSLAGNEQLLAVADDLHRRSQWPLISAPVLRHGVLVADAAEHTALLDALIAQDLTVVQTLVREHFTGSEC